MKIIMGIDPGLSGAFATLSGDNLIVEDMPTFEIVRGGKAKRDLNLQALAKRIEGLVPHHAFVEQVASRPEQGVSSVFAFGKGYGSVLGILAALGIPYTLVTPQVWKRRLGVPASKDGARLRASQLMPHGAHNWPLVKHDGRAEASMIAWYGVHSEFGGVR